jgi:putative spermidine/putrescine transport system permease protein
MKRNTFWSWFWLGLGVLYFTLPLIATFLFSMRAKKGVLSFLAYQNIFNDPKFWGTFMFSLVAAIFTIIVSVLLVVPTAYWIRLRLPQLRTMIEFITMLPFVIPAIVLAFGLISVYSGAPFHLTGTFFGTDVLLVAAYAVLALPYMFRAADSGLGAIDVRSLTEAAQSLGANWFTILFRVIFPNLRVAILSGAFLTLATVIGEFTIASFVVGNWAFGPYMALIGQNQTYEAASLTIISLGLTWAFMGLLQFITRGRAESLAGAH